MEERGLEQIATLSIDIAIASGLSSAHRKMTKADPRQRVVMEGYDWAVMSGLRQDPVTDDTNESSIRADNDRHSSDNARMMQSTPSAEFSGEDGEQGLDEYLAVRGKQGHGSHYSNKSSPTLGREDDHSEDTGRGQDHRDSSSRPRGTGSESNTSYTSSEEAEKGWKQRYREWKDSQVSSKKMAHPALSIKSQWRI